MAEIKAGPIEAIDYFIRRYREDILKLANAGADPDCELMCLAV